MKGIFSGIGWLEQGLNAASLRQQVIANNIANVDTPNFKSSNVRFEDLLKQKLNQQQSTFVGRRTDPRHFVIGASSNQAAVQPEIVTNTKTAMNNNNNNVDIDSQMAMLANNQLRYNVMAQEVSSQFKQLQTVLAKG